jgi:transcriptional regulator with XRE-family HTH domain
LTPKQFKTRREALGLSQAALAQRFGVTVGTVSLWERAERPIMHEGMVELALMALEKIVLPQERSAAEAEE